MTNSFVHLRVHSEYSLVDGMVRVKPLLQAVADAGMPAVAISDRSNLFALVKFYNAALEKGVKAIVAADVWVEAEDETEEPAILVLIAQNNLGYRNLCELLSEGYLSGLKLGKPVLHRQWLKDKSDGILVLSGAGEGEIGRALVSGRMDHAVSVLREWMVVFPDRFYLELQRTGRPEEEPHVHRAVDLALAEGCPVVATNDVRFLVPEEFEAHEVRVCIHDGRMLNDPRRVRKYNQSQYLKSPLEMSSLFSDLPEAIENTVEIAKRCSVTMELGKTYLPEYPLPAGLTTEAYFEKMSREGLEQRLSMNFDRFDPSFEEIRKPYDERLAYELDVIIQMGYPGYFLIVMEFIKWAKQNDIPVGPGRGSGPGSLVAYSLEITDIDPLHFDLLFERFLNPDRVSLPDFDIDFCMDGRDRVIQHVTERYGRDAVSQIITFGTMAAKAVVRDVARVQGKPYGLADKLSKLIPFDPGMTLTKAIAEEPLLREFIEQSEDAQEIMDMAFKLEGLARNIGIHAAGVVIAPTKLTDFTPVLCEEDGSGLRTQFDWIDVEQAGLVKFDFLGLRTLTIIDRTVKSINAQTAASGDRRIDINKISLEDSAVYEMLRQAKTTAIFQLESRGMKDLIRKVLPTSFDDIVALVALFRPGPMMLADDFINRKHGREQVDYLHPKLEPVLKNTYGVMLYQEQVMKIAQVLAGYSLAEADLLRRAMGKKKPEEMAQQRDNFRAGAVARGVDEKQADYIFDLMEKFAGYGFNRPHSVSYALIAYQTAWLKVHYPARFMASVLSSDMDNTDKVVTNIDECREMKLQIMPPDINRGDYRFVVDGDERIIYGLGAIKGLGEGAIEGIVESRRQDGQFKDLFDFCERVELKKVNKRVVEALIGSGALDGLVPDHLAGRDDSEDLIDFKRSLLSLNQKAAIGIAEQKARSRDSGHLDLFGEDIIVSKETRYNHLDDFRCWTFRERLNKEKETLGLYLTGHPIDLYQEELGHLAKTRICDLRVSKDAQTIAGMVIGLRTMKSRNGGTIAFVTLDDRTSRVELSVFGELYDQHHDKLLKDSLLVVKGSVSPDEFSGGIRMRANEVWTLVQARERTVKRLLVSLSGHDLTGDFSRNLADVLEPYKGKNGCPVFIDYLGKSARAEIMLGEEWRVEPHDDLIQKLKDEYGPDGVNLDY